MENVLYIQGGGRSQGFEDKNLGTHNLFDKGQDDFQLVLSPGN